MLHQKLFTCEGRRNILGCLEIQHNVHPNFKVDVGTRDIHSARFYIVVWTRRNDDANNADRFCKSFNIFWIMEGKQDFSLSFTGFKFILCQVAHVNNISKSDFFSRV